MEPVRRVDGLQIAWWEWLLRPRRSWRVRKAAVRLIAMRPPVDAVSDRVAAARLYDDMGMHEEADVIRRDRERS